MQEYEGHAVLFVYVPEQAAKPVHMKGKLTDAYYRSAGHTTPMTENQVCAMLAQTQGLEFEERSAVEHLTVDQLLQRLDHKTLLERMGETSPSTGELTALRMEAYGLCKAEPNGLWTITNLGAILFAFFASFA